MTPSQSPHGESAPSDHLTSTNDVNSPQEGSTPDVIGNEEDRELPLDVIFHTLKNSRRRHVLRYLMENGGRSTLSSLAERIAAIENGIPEQRLTSDQRKRVYVGLYQCHLPKMDDVGVIEYNQARGNVELTDRIRDFEEYLEDSDDEPTRQWPFYYAGLSVAGLALVVATALSALPASALTAVSVLTMCAVVGCSAYHWWVEDTEER